MSFGECRYIRRKKRMKKVLTALATAAVLAAGCMKWNDDGFHGRRDGQEGRDDGSKDTLAPPPVPVFDTVLYISAVEYPEGYDWVRDTASGLVEARIVLYRDSVKLLEVPTGFSHDVSPSPDMHRIVDGHLYTYFPNDSQTVIKRDGADIIRYDVREVIKGFMVEDGHVHTLGQNREVGGGIAYRIDGEELFLRRNATVIGEPDDGGWPTGALYKDREAVAFAYKIGSIYYIYHDGQSEEIRFHESPSDLYDIRRVGGKTYSLARFKSYAYSPAMICDFEGPVYFHEGQMKTAGCGIIPDGSDFSIKHSSPSGSGASWYLWSNGFNKSVQAGFIPYDFFASAGCVDAVGTRNGSICFTTGGMKKYISVEGNYRFTSSRCGVSLDGKLYAILTGMDDYPNLVIADGRVRSAGVNGVLTGLEVRIEERSQSSQ